MLKNDLIPIELPLENFNTTDLYQNVKRENKKDPSTNININESIHSGDEISIGIQTEKTGLPKNEH